MRLVAAVQNGRPISNSYERKKGVKKQEDATVKLLLNDLYPSLLICLYLY